MRSNTHYPDYALLLSQSAPSTSSYFILFLNHHQKGQYFINLTYLERKERAHTGIAAPQPTRKRSPLFRVILVFPYPASQGIVSTRSRIYRHQYQTETGSPTMPFGAFRTLIARPYISLRRCFASPQKQVLLTQATARCAAAHVD